MTGVTVSPLHASEASGQYAPTYRQNNCRHCAQPAITLPHKESTMFKSMLYLLFAIVFALLSTGCDENGQPIDPELCSNPLYNQYTSQACTNVRSNRGITFSLDECRNPTLGAYGTLECTAMRLNNPPAPSLDLTLDGIIAPCTTCDTATSGGQTMNPNNVIQSTVDAVECSDSSNPRYYDASCLAYQIANP